ncbi:MAG: SEC-C domain-containing protein [Proteobacteria bacterium]|nr:SEC-C domain-containing protein [Pseudomonadota bacterium]
MVKPKRNDPCPCGSGKKYKKCCYDKDQAGRSVRRGIMPVFDDLLDTANAAKMLKNVRKLNSGGSDLPGVFEKRHAADVGEHEESS